MEQAIYMYLGDVMKEGCRDQMEDMLYIDALDAAEKTRICYNRFYKLVKLCRENLKTQSSLKIKNK